MADENIAGYVPGLIKKIDRNAPTINLCMYIAFGIWRIAALPGLVYAVGAMFAMSAVVCGCTVWSAAMKSPGTPRAVVKRSILPFVFAAGMLGMWLVIVV